MKRKTFAVILSLVAILCVLAMSGLVAVFLILNSPPTELSGGLEFEVKKGETLAAIAQRLQNAKLVRSELFLRIFARLTGTEDDYQSGVFLIPYNSTTLDIHSILINGKSMQIRVVIPEGWTLSKIASRLQDAFIVDKDAFLAASNDAAYLAEMRIPGKSAEGFLFPDTYFFAKNSDPKLVLKVFFDNFFGKLKQILGPEDSVPIDKALLEKVILASIIEREYRSPEEAPLIASVFQNRLSIRMGLGSCATVEYIITEIRKRPHPERLFYQDLLIDSPYNTYKYRGLPPGPISNPGLVALKAAFQPAETDFLYFVLQDSGEGTHSFSKTLDEHNSARNLYLKRFGSEN